ncbi:hypothetical protein Tco_1328131 [Tanacetum coccineum]
MRQTKNLMDINIDALYNILKQKKGDVNDAMGYKKKTFVVTSDPLALAVEKTKFSKGTENVIVQSDSEGSDDEDISDLKNIIALLAKDFNRKKYYAKPTNNNLRTSSASTSANKKPEYVKSEEKKEDKKEDGKKQDMSKLGWSQVVIQKLSANMVFMAKIEKIFSDSKESSSSAKETIIEISYYSPDYEYETSDYYDNSINYGLFVDNDDDQKTFHDAVEYATENLNVDHIMANLLEGIQCAGSDTRPPMLDRTDFASWQQRIRLYCREGNEGTLHLGPERPRVYSVLSPEDKDRYNADIRATNILLQGLPKDIYSLINHYTDAKDIWDNVKMLLEGSELTKEDRATGYGGAHNRVGNDNPSQARQENGVVLDEEQLLFITSRQDNSIDEDLDEQPVQDLALNVDNVFQADDCDAFDSDVDEAPMRIPTAQTMFMANLSSVDHVMMKSVASYDSDILTDVPTMITIQMLACEHHEEHEMHDDVQPNYVVNSHADYTSNSNMISM